MISCQYLSPKSLKKTHKRLSRILAKSCKESAGSITVAGDIWVWRPSTSSAGIGIRYGNDPAGIRVEVDFRDSSDETKDLFESLACSPGVFERSQIPAVFEPIKIPPSWASYSSELMPAEIIMPRWEGMHTQEKAYATCLFDCVRLEHMLRKHLPDDWQATVSKEDMAEPDDEQPEEKEDSSGMEITVAKVTLGKVAWEFSNQPEHADLLLGMGCQQHVVKLVAFRNYLIHGDAGQRYLMNKLRKRFVMLQRMLYHLKRWPQSLRLHRALARLIQQWHSRTQLLGPPAPPSHLLIEARMGRLGEFSLGLQGAEAELLATAVAMLVKCEPSFTPEQMDELGGKLEKVMIL
ncbi:hypothetical protein EMGBS10_10030 [Opitutia bacterium]|nr:hypothetical protein EMGBS10_10030 [Opitutae bacterium]